MSAADLRISPTLSLPVDAATETFGILAKKGAGKSNAAVVMAEEMYDAGVPWVELIDWWCQRIPPTAQTALRTLAKLDDGTGVTIDDLADAAGWSRTSSGPGAAVATLVKLGLVTREGRTVYLDGDLR